MLEKIKTLISTIIEQDLTSNFIHLNVDELELQRVKDEIDEVISNWKASTPFDTRPKVRQGEEFVSFKYHGFAVTLTIKK